MDKRLLTILRCPISHKGLSLLKKDQLERVNAAIESGSLSNVDGETVTLVLTEALVSDDGKRLYPVDDGIPVLLEDEAISLEQAGLERLV